MAMMTQQMGHTMDASPENAATNPRANGSLNALLSTNATQTLKVEARAFCIFTVHTRMT
jgi:hypothetical protein